MCPPPSAPLTQQPGCAHGTPHRTPQHRPIEVVVGSHSAPKVQRRGGVSKQSPALPSHPIPPPPPNPTVGVEPLRQRSSPGRSGDLWPVLPFSDPSDAAVGPPHGRLWGTAPSRGYGVRHHPVPMGHSSVQLLWGIPCACPGLSYGAAELRKGVGIRAGFRIRNGVGIGVGIGVTHSADGTAAPFPALPPPAMTQLTARCYTPAN